MTARRAALLVPVMAALALLQPLPAKAGAGQAREIARFRVQSVDQDDGGRLVRLSRGSGAWRFEYRLSFWRGNGGVIVGAVFRGGDCRTGDVDRLRKPVSAMARSTLDGMLADDLRECPLPPVREAALRRSLDAAWAEFSAKVEQAWTETQAEAAAIEHYGEER